jgi:hypothetical protein
LQEQPQRKDEAGEEVKTAADRQYPGGRDAASASIEQKGSENGRQNKAVRPEMVAPLQQDDAIA